MLPLSPALFLAAAVSLIPSDQPTERLSNRDRGNELDPMARDHHHPDDGVTTAAFLAHVGYWSHRRTLGESSWPFPLNADCDALARLGSDLGVVNVGTPDPGAIYLRYSRRERRFTSASIVIFAFDVVIPDFGWTYDCHVLEGSARLTHRGVPFGRAHRGRFKTSVNWVRRKRVTCCPGHGDRFLSWVDLDGRGALPVIRPKEKAA